MKEPEPAHVFEFAPPPRKGPSMRCSDLHDHNGLPEWHEGLGYDEPEPIADDLYTALHGLHDWIELALSDETYDRQVIAETAHEALCAILDGKPQPWRDGPELICDCLPSES